MLAGRFIFQFSGDPVGVHFFEAETEEIIRREMLDGMEILFQAIEYWLCFRRLLCSEDKFGHICGDVGSRSTSCVEDMGIVEIKLWGSREMYLRFCNCDRIWLTFEDCC